MHDLISRKEAIEALCQAGCGSGYCGISCDDVKAIERLPSAQQWIPVSERLPEDLEEVNVTWVNHDPAPYYNFVKDKPFTATAIYYKEKWYWYSSTCVDLLAEYGRNPYDEIDDRIEIIAWMPLPSAYQERKDESDI